MFGDQIGPNSGCPNVDLKKGRKKILNPMKCSATYPPNMCLKSTVGVTAGLWDVTFSKYTVSVPLLQQCFTLQQASFDGGKHISWFIIKLTFRKSILSGEGD